MRWGIATDRGAVRTINEDSAVVAGTFAAVADGMGGYAAGDVASRIAIDAIHEVTSDSESPRPELLLRAVEIANQRILEASVDKKGRSGMGTTLTGVGLVSIGGTDHWLVFNVGDSRVYRWDSLVLRQITVDHSLVEELVASGELSFDEARSDSRRNIVTRALGSDPAPLVDTWLFPTTPGERFVICSDGLSGEMTDEQIRDVLVREADPSSAAATLVRQAVAAGGRDNVTVIVVDLAPVYEPDLSSVPTQPRFDVADGILS